MEGVPTDIGLVGEVIAVNDGILHTLLDATYIPVVSSFGSNSSGEVLNINADTAAGAIAASLAAEALIVLTDVAGLYRDWPNQDSIIRELSALELRELWPSLESGMVPKMEACLRALELGAREALIIDGRIPHGLLAAFDKDGTYGTRVLP